MKSTSTPIRGRRPFAGSMAAALLLACTASAVAQVGHFRRIATFPVFSNTSIDTETVSEIITATPDGMTLIHTDAATGNIGFVDITDPADPQPAGVVEIGGEPTSVAVLRGYAVAATDTSESFSDPSGELVIIDIATQTIVHRMDLGGQPDSVAVSPNNRFIAVVMENQRNEDACTGGAFDGEEVDEDDCEAGGGLLGYPGQAPSGSLIIVDVIGRGPSDWRTRTVDLTGVADLYPGDAEPEFVDINSANQAVVTMQENNHIVIVNLANGRIVNDFSAGTADLHDIDVEEEDVINLDGSLEDVRREPDAVKWISRAEIATADEGDLVGGSRGFTIFNVFTGGVRFTSGNQLEHLATRIGHYPESRSENKGSEPEGIEYALYGNRRMLFVASERGSFVAVYELPAIGDPKFLQALPGGLGPEGLKAIPSRNLFVTASENDSREDTFRSAITIYELLPGAPNYPTIQSANGADRKPIPWSALSALAADPADSRYAYTVEDSYYAESSIFKIDMTQTPPTIISRIDLVDRDGAPLSYDPEGVAVRSNGGFLVASEGSGSCSEIGVCDGVNSPNLILMVDPYGRVTREISLPAAVNDIQRNNGFEGVAVTGSGDSEVIWAAFQREWNLVDPAGWARIGRYEVATGEWTFYYYPLSSPTSPNGGWIGLSEITAVGGGRFVVIERDNQAGADARFKRLYSFSTSRVTPLAHEDLPTDPTDPAFPALTKTLLKDVLPDLESANGYAIEKVEGFMMLNGEGWIVTDNDGVDDSSGETQLLNVGPLAP